MVLDAEERDASRVIMEAVVRQGPAAFGALGCALFVRDGDDWWTLSALDPSRGALARVALPRDAGLVRRVAEQGAAISLPRLDAAPDAHPSEALGFGAGVALELLPVASGVLGLYFS